MVVVYPDGEALFAAISQGRKLAAQLARGGVVDSDMYIKVGNCQEPLLVTSVNINRHVTPTSFVVHAITPKNYVTSKEKTNEEFRLKS